jgi:endonuclease/exonuclease/phosphatase family metal-dependent hydrolase
MRVDGLVSRLEAIKTKYEELSLVLFGDFNLKRNEVEKRIAKKVNRVGYNCLYQKGDFNYSRY